MRTQERKTATGAGNTAETVRSRIEGGGERVWRLADFKGLPLPAVAQTLSRLARRGQIQRLGKGLYYRPRQTAFGPSRPNMARIRSIAAVGKGVFPAGIAAANLLGFTTQNPARIELATVSLSLPRLLLGQDALIHTRRPPAWQACPRSMLLFLTSFATGGNRASCLLTPRSRGCSTIFVSPGTSIACGKVAPSEPPRVRAMLGAIGEQIGQSQRPLAALRGSLNPLSRFDFGILAALAYARRWQAKSAGTMRLFEHPDFEQAIIRAAEHFRPRPARGDHREGLLRHRSPAPHLSRKATCRRRT